MPWLRNLLGRQTPVTLSVGGMDRVRDLRRVVASLPLRSRPDFSNPHYFTGGAEQAERLFASMRDLVAPTPLWIGELGYPTSTTTTGYAGVPLTPSGQEAAQEHFLRLCFGALARLELPAPGLWILDDFAPGAIPRSDVSPKEPEYRFGLFREDGSPKPAAALVRRLFAGEPDTGFNGDFEGAALAEDGTSVPAVWGSTGRLRLVRDPGAHWGEAAARIAGPAGGRGVFTVAPVDASVEKGHHAEIAAWIRGSGTIRLGVTWYDRYLREAGSTSTRVRAERGWRSVAVRSAPPAAAEFGRITVEAAALSGPVWLDDVSFAWLPGDDVGGAAGDQRVEHVGRVDAA